MLRGIPVAVSLCQTQIHVVIEVLYSDIEFLLLSFLHITAHRLYGSCLRLSLRLYPYKILRTTELVFMEFDIRKFYSVLSRCLVTVKVEENNGHIRMLYAYLHTSPL